MVTAMIASGDRDSRPFASYSEAMELGVPYIRLKLDTDQPVELSKFVAAFTALADEYERFIRTEQPDADPAATLFVKEVRQGCIEADLIPWIAGAAAALIGFAASANTLGSFVERYGKILRSYKKKGANDPKATSTQLQNFSDQVAAIADAPGSTLRIAAMEIVDGQTTTKVAFTFDSSEARAIRDNVDRHRRQLENKKHAQHERVLMTFTRSDVGKTPLGKRSGEKVIIEAIAPGKRLGLAYGSNLAEDRIKHEIAEAEDNVYKKGFVVDVNVEIVGGKPRVYSVTHLHQIIDIDDD